MPDRDAIMLSLHVGTNSLLDPELPQAQFQTNVLKLFRHLTELLDAEMVAKAIRDGNYADSFGCFTMKPGDYQRESAVWPQKKAFLRALLDLQAAASELNEAVKEKSPHA